MSELNNIIAFLLEEWIWHLVLHGDWYAIIKQKNKNNKTVTVKKKQ